MHQQYLKCVVDRLKDSKGIPAVNARVGAIARWTVGPILLSALIACGGGGGGGSGGNGGNGGGGGSNTYAIGGNVTGLNGSVVLQDNAVNNLTFGSNGSFTFTTRVSATYAVTVLTQPAGQTCSVTAGSGTAIADVTNVAVTCANNPAFNIGGAIAGLAAGASVVIQDNGGDALTLPANATFVFPTKVPAGASYAVTVLTQPAGQTCSVTNGSGTVSSADVTNVAIACTNNPPVISYSVGGSFSGLFGTIVLQDNGSDDLTVIAPPATNFAFAGKLGPGAVYGVTVKAQPLGQNCAVSNGSGMASADVTNVSVVCVPTGPAYTLGGSITGLAVAGLKLGGPDNTTMTVASGATRFLFPALYLAATPVGVSILTQPAGETCAVTNAAGTPDATTTSVAYVLITCVANTTDAIVGVFNVGTTSGQPSNGWISFNRDGTYVYALVSADPTCGLNNGNGIEYGVYNWNKTSNAFSFVSLLIDTNGSCGLWSNNVYAGGATTQMIKNFSVCGTSCSGGLLSMTLKYANGTMRTLTPVASTPSTLIGAFAQPSIASQGFGFFDASGHYLIASTQLDAAAGNPSNTLPGIEAGCYTAANGSFSWDLSASCVPFPATATTPAIPAFDTNGSGGFASMMPPIPYAIGGLDNVQFGTAPNATSFTRIRPG